MWKESVVLESNNINGIVPPMITPFDKDGEVDEGALRELISFLIDYVQGIFICGTYGSGPLMDVNQRKKVAEVAAELTSGKIKMIVHVGATNTKTAVELARHAESVGATHISSVPPYYYKHTEDEIILYFNSILKAVDIPVYVYNNPKTVGYQITPGFLNKLADLGISGVKDSSFDIMILNDYIRCVEKENFDVVLGTEAMFLPASVLGVKAFIPGLGNAFPEIVVELYEACINRRYDEAMKIQNKVLYLRDTMHIAGANIPSVHEMLKFRKINAGLPKSPYFPLDKEMSNKIYERLKKIEII